MAKIKPKIRNASAHANVDSAPKHEVPTAQWTFHAAAMYGIHRSAKDKNWAVILKRGRVVYSKAFSFGIHGGEEAALLLAQAWRDEVVKKYPPASRRKLAEKLRSDSKTGIPGVLCRLDARGEPIAWRAMTQLFPGQKVAKQFSVSRYGAAEAKRLAIAERQKQLRQMTGLQRVHPSEVTVRIAPPREPVPLPRRIDLAEIVRTPNPSGVVGVVLTKDAKGRPARWTAATHVGDKRVSESFSIKVHGDEQAKALAVAAREKHLKMRAESQRAKKPRTRKPR
jgi:hypothetical protein